MVPSERFIEHCLKNEWNYEFTFKGAGLHHRYGLPKPPGELSKGVVFLGISFYPTTEEQRLEDAFWDCLGKTTFRPSGELFVVMYCSSTQQVAEKEKRLFRKLRKAGIRPGNFPHQLFDRWDLMAHAPDAMYVGGETPEYAVRFIRDKVAGLYSRDDSKLLRGRAYPHVDELLASPPAGNPGSFFAGKSFVRVENGEDEFIDVDAEAGLVDNFDRVMAAYMEIVKNFENGDYDHEHEDMYDFKNETDSAIILGETLTGKKSKQRIKTDSFDASKKVH